MRKHKAIAINVSGDLRGKPVLAADTAEKLGEVSDAILDPTGGRVLGFVLGTPAGENRAIAAGDIRIGEDAIMAAPGALLQPHGDDAAPLRGVDAYREIVGASVVTTEGKRLGRVSDVYISTEWPVAVYRVAESALQGLFGRGYFLPGSVLRAFSREGPRLLVPADAERYATSSLEDALMEPAGRS